jgi:hypothetical protein
MSLQEFKAKFVENGIMDAEECVEFRTVVFEDGKVDLEELRIATELQNELSGAENAPEWKTLYTDILCSYALDDEDTPGVVDESEADTLITLLEDIDSLELYALTQMCARGTEVHPKLIAHVSKCIVDLIAEDGIVDDDEIEILEAFVYGAGGDGGAKVTWDEAKVVQEINDLTDAKLSECSEKWEPFYVKVMTDVMLADDDTPGVVSDEEATQFVEMIKGDGKYNPCELSAMTAIKSEATEISPILEAVLEMNQI